VFFFFVMAHDIDTGQDCGYTERTPNSSRAIMLTDCTKGRLSLQRSSFLAPFPSFFRRPPFFFPRLHMLARRHMVSTVYSFDM